MRQALLVGVGGFLVGIGVGVSIGWFAKPDDEIPTVELPPCEPIHEETDKIVNSFIKSVESDKLRNILKEISGKYSLNGGKKIMKNNLQRSPTTRRRQEIMN